MALEQIAGADIWVHRTGEGTPLLMAHCALAHHEALLPLLRNLPVTAATLFDLPSHGRSARWSGEPPLQQLVTAQMAALAPEPTHVFGHSFGATCALRFALEHPEKVLSLTLAEPVFFAAAKGTEAHRLRQEEGAVVAAALAKGDPVEAARLFLSKWGALPWGAMPEGAKAQAAENISLIEATEPELEGDPTGQLAPGRLEGLTCPTLLFEGGKSHPVVGEIMAVLDRRIPNARRVVLEKAGHMLPLSHPKAVAAEMQATMAAV